MDHPTRAVAKKWVTARGPDESIYPMEHADAELTELGEECAISVRVTDHVQ